MSWTLDIKEMSWVEHTKAEVDFIISALQLGGQERILDLACGFGRHSLELASRGFEVVGVDVTQDYILDAQKTAQNRGLKAQFICANVLNLNYQEEFDVVINMADGAIGYFVTETENLKLFDIIARALKRGGKHIMGVCNADHARKHFPKRHWEAGKYRLSLADFKWNEETCRMIYQGHLFKYGEILAPVKNDFEADPDQGTRLYGLQELEEIFAARKMEIIRAFGAYDTSITASDDRLMLVVYSQKI